MKAPDYEIMECEYCRGELLSSKVSEHIDSVHHCAICGGFVRNLEMHIEMNHRDETDRVKEDAHGD